MTHEQLFQDALRQMLRDNNEQDFWVELNSDSDINRFVKALEDVVFDNFLELADQAGYPIKEARDSKLVRFATRAFFKEHDYRSWVARRAKKADEIYLEDRDPYEFDWSSFDSWRID